MKGMVIIFLITIETSLNYEQTIQEQVLAAVDGPGSHFEFLKVDPDCVDDKGKKLEYFFYHNETVKCFEQKKRGPCGNFMMFYQENAESKYGKCSCIADDTGRQCNTKLNRPIARWKEDNQCYLLYDQGPCDSPNEWFVLNQERMAVCLPNPCQNLEEPEVNMTIWKWASDVNRFRHRFNPERDWKEPVGLDPWELNQPFWFQLNGKCYKTHTKGPCQKDNEIIIFTGTHFHPTCFQYDGLIGVCGWSNSGLIECPKGSIEVGDDCAPEATDWE